MVVVFVMVVCVVVVVVNVVVVWVVMLSVVKLNMGPESSVVVRVETVSVELVDEVIAVIELALWREMKEKIEVV